jgi:hypothetical protein
MFGLVSYHVKNLLTILLLLSSILLLGESTQLHAACRGEGFMGISSNDPIMSWVDLTYSPTYSSASTSGTLGCKNWNFSQYIEHVRRKFLKQTHSQLLAETVQGHGSHLEALTILMTCPPSSVETFSGMLWEHRQQTVEIFETSKQSQEFLTELRKWIKANPELRNTCRLS